ncbi:MAG: ribonuclease E/G [Clostridia bacterium]|nr:ribonuclease E/G [Clostridia bacterium]
MKRSDEMPKPERDLYFGSSSFLNIQKPAGTPENCTDFYAVYESGRLTEFRQYGSASPEPGDIYIGKAGDYIRNNSSLFVTLSEKKEGSLRGYLKSDEYRPGDKVLVQVTAPAKDNKLCRLSDRPAISGRYLVLILNDDTISVNVSSKICSDTESDRLKQLGIMLLGRFNDALTAKYNGMAPGAGLIIRTDASLADHNAIESEFLSITSEADKIIGKYADAGKGNAPFLVRSVSDIDKWLLEFPLCTVKHIFTDSVQKAEAIKNIIAGSGSELSVCGKEMYEKIGRDLARSTGRTVELRSGGNIVIDRTEALTVFDVNSGSSIHAGSKHELIMNTNLEAAAEIARQLRLRAITGIVVCDFINMENDDDEREIISFMEDLFKNDPAHVETAGFTRLRLLEIVRSRGVYA